MGVYNLDKHVAFEQGTLTPADMVQLLAEMIRDGSIWTFPGVYGRTAQVFIDQGILGPEGQIDWSRFNDLAGEYDEDGYDGSPFWCPDCQTDDPSRCVCGIGEIEIPPSEY